MAWKDEVKYANKVFQNGTFREKWEYFWEYYKKPFIILLLIIGILGSTIYRNVTAKENVLCGIFLNSADDEEGVTQLERGFMEYASIDTETEEVLFDAGYYFSLNAGSTSGTSAYETLQVFAARIAAKEIDFTIGDFSAMNFMVYNQYFYNLSEVLSEDLLEKYETLFLYYDKAFMEKLYSEDINVTASTTIAYPDPEKPELMEEPVAFAIDVSGCEKMRGIYSDIEEKCAMAFTVNGENRAKALELLMYLMEY